MYKSGRVLNNTEKKVYGIITIFLIIYMVLWTKRILFGRRNNNE